MVTKVSVRFEIDPPLLPGEVEIDVSDLVALDATIPAYVRDDVDLLATSRGNVRDTESQLRIERMIADARARRRGSDGGGRGRSGT